jgi:PPK2 family polyphosphate:nucleotide phosphotransferase
VKSAIEVRPGKKIRLKDISTNDDAGLGTKEKARERLGKDLERLRELQLMLFADGRYSLLVVLQAMDTGGKDGTIRHVMSGFNPAGCDVVSFKAPSENELKHDFLWRVHQAVPPKGMIGVFNRSHYEDVLVVRVHDLVPKKVWEERYWQINDFEKMLTENNVVILKFFLHISRTTQRERFESLARDPLEKWRVTEADWARHKKYDQYLAASEEMLELTESEYGPWTIVEATSRWHARKRVFETIIAAMERRLGPKAPPRAGFEDSEEKDADLRAAMDSLGGKG